VNWYALQTAPQREAAASRLLREEGFTTYLPVTHVVRRRHRVSKQRVVHGMPGLPGYLFIGFNDDEPAQWSRLARSGLVLGVVGVAGEPLAFSFRDMLWVAMSSQRPRRYLNDRRAKHRVGFTAPIVSGPYEGRTVRVIEAEGRVRELYELVRRET
jgi:transcription antitermination factor NusG